MLKKFNVSQECDTLVSLVWTGGCSGAYNLINTDWTFPLFKALCFSSSQLNSAASHPHQYFWEGKHFQQKFELGISDKENGWFQFGVEWEKPGPLTLTPAFLLWTGPVQASLASPPLWSLLCVGGRTDQKPQPKALLGGFNKINPEAMTASPVALGLLLFSALYLKNKNKQKTCSLYCLWLLPIPVLTNLT